MKHGGAAFSPLKCKVENRPEVFTVCGMYYKIEACAAAPGFDVELFPLPSVTLLFCETTFGGWVGRCAKTETGWATLFVLMSEG